MWPVCSFLVWLSGLSNKPADDDGRIQEIFPVHFRGEGIIEAAESMMLCCSAFHSICIKPADAVCGTGRAGLTVSGRSIEKRMMGYYKPTVITVQGLSIGPLNQGGGKSVGVANGHRRDISQRMYFP